MVQVTDDERGSKPFSDPLQPGVRKLTDEEEGGEVTCHNRVYHSLSVAEEFVAVLLVVSLNPLDMHCLTQTQESKSRIKPELRPPRNAAQTTRLVLHAICGSRIQCCAAVSVDSLRSRYTTPVREYKFPTNFVRARTYVRKIARGLSAKRH